MHCLKAKINSLLTVYFGNINERWSIQELHLKFLPGCRILQNKARRPGDFTEEGKRYKFTFEPKSSHILTLLPIFYLYVTLRPVILRIETGTCYNRHSFP